MVMHMTWVWIKNYEPIWYARLLFYCRFQVLSPWWRCWPRSFPWRGPDGRKPWRFRKCKGCTKDIRRERPCAWCRWWESTCPRWFGPISLFYLIKNYLNKPVLFLTRGLLPFRSWPFFIHSFLVSTPNKVVDDSQDDIES